MLGFLQGLIGNGDNGPPESDHEMISLVVLYRDYVDLTLEQLCEHLDAVFPGAFLPPGDINFVVEGAVPDVTFMIKSIVQGAAGLFMLHNIPAPYTEFSNILEIVDDPVLRETIAATTAWMSIDLVSAFGSNEDAWRFIGRMLARIAPTDAVFLLHPDSGGVIAFDDDIRRALAEGREMFARR